MDAEEPTPRYAGQSGATYEEPVGTLNCFTEEQLAAHDRRVRAAVAEEIAQDLDEWAKRQRAQSDAAWNPQSSRTLHDYGVAYDGAAAIARRHAVASAERSVDAPARPFVQCELPADGAWCGLPIGHDGPCVPADVEEGTRDAQ